MDQTKLNSSPVVKGLLLRFLLCVFVRLQQRRSQRTFCCRRPAVSCRTPWDVWAPAQRTDPASLLPSPVWRVWMKQVKQVRSLYQLCLSLMEEKDVWDKVMCPSLRFWQLWPVTGQRCLLSPQPPHPPSALHQPRTLHLHISGALLRGTEEVHISRGNDGRLRSWAEHASNLPIFKDSHSQVLPDPASAITQTAAAPPQHQPDPEQESRVTAGQPYRGTRSKQVGFTGICSSQGKRVIYQGLKKKH